MMPKSLSHSALLVFMCSSSYGIARVEATSRMTVDGDSEQEPKNLIGVSGRPESLAKAPELEKHGSRIHDWQSLASWFSQPS
jgi:hypothetical protein